ncbi:MAG: helix-turn-helix domain-containing protein [Bacteroidales bacterium]
MTFGGGSEQEFIGKLTQITLDHLADENFGGNELAVALGMSWSTLNRKVQAATGQHISQFIREIRLKTALELLQDNNDTAAEVAYKVGFGGPAYFNKCFNDFYGFPPGEVKKRMAEGTLPLPEENLYAEGTVEVEGETTVPLPTNRFKKPYLLAASVGLGVLLIAFAIFYLARKGEFTYQLRGQEKSIAVLPFKNLSSEADNQYFADGITEDILNHLFRISDLRVISRTTAERFRDSELPSPEIAKSMGVNYLLEGSVRKLGDNVRITVQLIDGKSDRHLWSENYDRQLADIFFIQSDIAQNVARELRAVLSPEEMETIERPISQSIGAYDYYLRGKDYYNRTNKEEDKRFAMQMYQKAVEIDPDFALAWVGLSAATRDLYWYFFDRSDDNLLKTKQYLDKALALAPELKEVRFEEVAYYYLCKQDYSRSMKILEKLRNEYPNNDEILFWLAMVFRRMGELEKSLEYINLAISLNPSFWNYWYNASWTYQALKDYKNAENYTRKAIDLNPSNNELFSDLFEIFLKTGQITKAKDFLFTNESYFKPQEFLFNQMQIEYFSKNLDKAIQFAHTFPGEGIFFQDKIFLKHLQLGIMYRSISDPDLANRHFELARDFLLEKIKELGKDWRPYGSLGIAIAGLGLKEEALDAVEKAMEILNLKNDGFAGIDPVWDLAKILILLREYDEALISLDRVLNHTGTKTTVEELKLDPFWDPVREHPRFKEIINNPAYQIRL